MTAAATSPPTGPGHRDRPCHGRAQALVILGLDPQMAVPDDAAGADRAPARYRSHLLHASVRSPWEAAVMCEQRADRCVTTLAMPNGSVADSCRGDLSQAMSRAALLVWAPSRP